MVKMDRWQNHTKYSSDNQSLTASGSGSKSNMAYVDKKLMEQAGTEKI